MKKVIGATAIAIFALGTTAALAMDNPAQNAHAKFKQHFAKSDRNVSSQVSVTDENTGSRNFGRVFGSDTGKFGDRSDVYKRLKSTQPRPAGR
jgi:hypothetical protein